MDNPGNPANIAVCFTPRHYNKVNIKSIKPVPYRHISHIVCSCVYKGATWDGAGDSVPAPYHSSLILMMIEEQILDNFMTSQREQGWITEHDLRCICSGYGRPWRPSPINNNTKI